jgi:hypothetical protein
MVRISLLVILVMSMIFMNLSKTPDLRFTEIVHTGIEDRDSFRFISQFFKLKPAQIILVY